MRPFLHTVTLSLAVTLLSVLIIIGSDLAASKMDGKGEKILRQSPAKIIKAFYEETRRRNYDLVESMHSERIIKLLKTNDALILGGGFKGYIEEATQGGELRLEKIIEEKRLLEGARVVYLVSGKNSKPVERTAYFVKEKGLWKINQLIE